MSNISPLDSRYKKQVSELNEYFSEQALMGFRLYVEIKYLIFLSKHRALKNLFLLTRKTNKSWKKFIQTLTKKNTMQLKKLKQKQSMTLTPLYSIYLKK